MNKLTDEQLAKYNSQGLIPGPDETEDAFVERVHFCLQIDQELRASIIPGVSISEEKYPDFQEAAFSVTQPFFDMRPSWVPLFFGNLNLTPWQGGCAWIFQLRKETPVSALLQLRKAFLYKKKYLLIYSRDEVMAHEFAHVGRMLFEEPKFEEVIAYRTATSAFRRFFGPLLQSPAEALIFVLILGMIVLIDVALVISGHWTLYEHAMGLKLIPCVMLGWWIVRLWKKQRQFSSCLRKLEEVLDSKPHANAVIYRLTDREIETFSRMTPSEICQKVKECYDTSLRWRVLRHYFCRKCL